MAKLISPTSMIQSIRDWYNNKFLSYGDAIEILEAIRDDYIELIDTVYNTTGVAIQSLEVSDCLKYKYLLVVLANNWKNGVSESKMRELVNLDVGTEIACGGFYTNSNASSHIFIVYKVPVTGNTMIMNCGSVTHYQIYGIYDGVEVAELENVFKTNNETKTNLNINYYDAGSFLMIGSTSHKTGIDWDTCSQNLYLNSGIQKAYSGYYYEGKSSSYCLTNQVPKKDNSSITGQWLSYVLLSLKKKTVDPLINLIDRFYTKSGESINQIVLNDLIGYESLLVVVCSSVRAPSSVDYMKDRTYLTVGSEIGTGGYYKGIANASGAVIRAYLVPVTNTLMTIDLYGTDHYQVFGIMPDVEVELLEEYMNPGSVVTSLDISEYEADKYCLFAGTNEYYGKSFETIRSNLHIDEGEICYSGYYRDDNRSSSDAVTSIKENITEFTGRWYGYLLIGVSRK